MTTILGIIAIILFCELDIAFVILIKLLFDIYKNNHKKGGDNDQTKNFNIQLHQCIMEQCCICSIRQCHGRTENIKPINSFRLNLRRYGCGCFSHVHQDQHRKVIEFCYDKGHMQKNRYIHFCCNRTYNRQHATHNLHYVRSGNMLYYRRNNKHYRKTGFNGIKPTNSNSKRFGYT